MTPAATAATQHIAAADVYKRQLYHCSRFHRIVVFPVSKHRVAGAADMAVIGKLVIGTQIASDAGARLLSLIHI